MAYQFFCKTRGSARGFLQREFRSPFVEWLTLRGENGKGLKVVAKDKIVFAVWLFSEQNLSTANFTRELEDAEYFTKNIDLIQPGVRGIDSWSIKVRPLEQYRLLEKNYSDGFNITPIIHK